MLNKLINDYSRKFLDLLHIFNREYSRKSNHEHNICCIKIFLCGDYNLFFFVFKNMNDFHF